MPCPLTALQLRAYELRAAGLSRPQAGVLMDRTPQQVSCLLAGGAETLGVHGYHAALEVLQRDGWAQPSRLSDPLAESYNRVAEAYRAAPADTRDDLPIGALYRLVANDLIGGRL